MTRKQNRKNLRKKCYFVSVRLIASAHTSLNAIVVLRKFKRINKGFYLNFRYAFIFSCDALFLYPFSLKIRAFALLNGTIKIKSGP